MKVCLSCSKKLENRFQRKYCSNQCQSDYKYNNYIQNWMLGIESGERGVVAKNISGYLRQYLFKKFESKCSECGWDKKHPITGNIPLEIDHIDGNAGNNKESNLRLLCPNCHSLTYNYRNLNKGKGRLWRKQNYA